MTNRFWVAYWRSWDGERGEVSPSFDNRTAAEQWLEPHREESHPHMFGIVGFSSLSDADDYRKYGLPI